LFVVGTERDGGANCKYETAPEDEGTGAVLLEGDLVDKSFSISQIISELIGDKESLMFELKNKSEESSSKSSSTTVHKNSHSREKEKVVLVFKKQSGFYGLNDRILITVRDVSLLYN
jgi:hypothetical protein